MTDNHPPVIPSPTEDQLLQILKEYWGYEAFRPLQRDIIESVMAGNDTLGLLPTGGGKSITFQVPALAMGGLCLVVTPLISLMKDQKDHLVRKGIKAAAIWSGMKHEEIVDTFERVIAQNYNFLYLSPERLETRLFQAKLHYMNVSMLVVDEAHCISQWGYDFRPSYMKIADIRQMLAPSTPCLALTATATPAVVEDICSRLNFRPNHHVFKASFVRPNLAYRVHRTADKLGQMLFLLRSVECGIVYVRSRQQTCEIAEFLIREGIEATFYHAGLMASEKQKRQDLWMQGKIRVIVATNAFGMGIDKPNVRCVIHYDLPPSPEEYFQEAGRAGRDGQPSTAILLYENKDRSKLQRNLTDAFPDRDYIRMVYSKLASYYQIAIGSGHNCSFEFDLMKFCAAYHLSATSVHYALRLLHQAGYLLYNEDPERLSRLMFTTSRESLYHLNQFDKDSQRVITTILRLYTGVFADYTFIREEDIMARTSLAREQLYNILLRLTRHHILHYIPARQVPAIMYLTPRLDNCELRIPRSIYEDRQVQQSKRMQAIFAYLDCNTSCRLRFLLEYFGEQLSETCGKCDICQPDDLKPFDQSRQTIHDAILSTLDNHTALPAAAIYCRLPFNPEHTAAIIREMVENGELTFCDQIIRKA